MSDDLYQETNDSIKYWTRDELLARAEAAEAETIETLENILLALGVDPNGIDEIYMEQTAKSVIDAISARVTELEAQLAANAGEWRSPDTVIESGPVQIILNAQAVDFFFYSPDESGRMIFKDSIVAWRPAPPQE